MSRFVFNYDIRVVVDNSIFIDIPIEGEESNIEPISSVDMIEGVYYLSKLKPFYFDDNVSRFIDSNILVNVDSKKRVTISAFSIYNYSDILNTASKVESRRSRCEKYTLKIVDGLYSDSINKEVSSWVDTLSFKRVDIDSIESKQNLHWVHYLSPVDMYVKSIPFLRVLDEYIVKNHLDDNYELARAHIYSGSNEDVYTKHRDSEYKEDITVVYYPGEWESNWGGEMLFYSCQETDVAIELKEGRVIIFNGYQEHRIAPISRSAKYGRKSIVIRYKKSSN